MRVPSFFKPSDDASCFEQKLRSLPVSKKSVVVTSLAGVSGLRTLVSLVSTLEAFCTSTAACGSVDAATTGLLVIHFGLGGRWWPFVAASAVSACAAAVVRRLWYCSFEALPRCSRRLERGREVEVVLLSAGSMSGHKHEW